MLNCYHKKFSGSLIFNLLKQSNANNWKTNFETSCYFSQLIYEFWFLRNACYMQKKSK